MEIGEVFDSILWYIKILVLIVTFPIWIIPFLIYQYISNNL